MKTFQLSISMPSTEDLTPLREKIKERLTTLFDMINESSSSFSSNLDAATSSSRFQFRKFKRRIKESRILPFVIVGAIFLILLGIGLRKVLTRPATTPQQASSDRVELKKPLSTQTVKKEISLPLKDAAGKQVSTIKLLVQSIELRDQIIIQGKIANTTVGKNILIVNIELTNNFTKPVQITSRNYFRLKKNNDNKLYDPKIHNDPLDVQPVSTTSTRLGFTVDDTDKNFILRVGDVTDPTSKIQEIKITNLR